MHTSPEHIHNIHRQRKFQARITQLAHRDDRGLLSWLAIGLLWLGVALLAGTGSGCKGHVTNENISATGTDLVRAETYVQLGIEATKDQVKKWLESAAGYIHSAQASNSRADEDFAKLAKDRDQVTKDRDQVKADYQHLYNSLGAKMERAVRAVVRWIKWLLIGWAALGALGFIFGFISPLAPFGAVLSTLWWGINSFAIGLLPHGTNVANFVGRITSIAKTPPI